MEDEKSLVIGSSGEELKAFLENSPAMKDKIEIVETPAETVPKIIAKQKKQFENQIHEMWINEYRFKNPKLFKHYARPLSAKGEYPNMPDRQPCPDCRRSCRKIDGHAQGATYHCPNHSDFFVATAKYGKERKKL
jgi:hypothetical protein